MATTPEFFFCPITHDVMADPVCDKEGNSFERSALTDWITVHGSSPITRTPMAINDLTPNRALKEAISQFYSKPIVPESKPEPITACESNFENDELLKIETFAQNSKLLIRVNPGDSQTRSHLNVSCVIDISGSMATKATIPGDADGTTNESFGLSILDVVKHAVRTVIKSLTAQDRLAIVTFSDMAEIALPFTEMNIAGQKLAISTLNVLQPTRSTNLWAGLEKGMDVLQEIQKFGDAGRLSAVMLFTDGEPNIIPPRGHLPMLQMYKDRLGSLPGSINTFGFGYTMDSQLLCDLASEGQGQYAFIPDSGFVGTIFVHAIANLMTTVANKCRLTIEPLNDLNILDPISLGKLLVSNDSSGLVLDIGSLQIGQTKDVLLDIQNLNSNKATEIPKVFITLTAKTRRDGNFKMAGEYDGNKEESNIQIPQTYFRFKSIQAICDVMKIMSAGDQPSYEIAEALIKNLIQEIERSVTVSADPQTAALLEDIKGQVLEALKLDFYQKWGRHYLPSLIYAHLNQVCNNFKDPGPQVYGGALFKRIRDETDILFCSIEPPKPSLETTHRGPINMRAYMNVSGGCFHGDGLVHMADGTKKKVDAIVKGDLVQTSEGKSASIVCVTQFEKIEKVIDLVECPSGLRLTPWHPIRLVTSQTWIFPNSIAEVKQFSCDAVFNFVLDQCHVVIIDEVECVTLGHSFTDEVCGHEYFGSRRVVDDLKILLGFADGLVKIKGFTWNAETNRVNGMVAT